jgi:ATP-dependent DNA helicase DinG
VVLAARVLLPNEILGSRYYPALDSAVFISATTWLRGGFEVASGYLGLDRAANPLENEAREPCVVESFRAADPFDYSRVLVCVPNDAPDPARDRERFQQFVRRFVAHLGERTRGRMLVLFTNADEARRTGEELSGFFRARGLPLFFQNMPGVRKEELGEMFRERVESILLGVDTFWYGADFPGETLEHLVLVKLPYGVPDRYHHAQCAALGSSEQRRRIYLPRALAKFRQGFGRLMRRETDRGCVYVLDPRVLHGANRLFLQELPLQADLDRSPDDEWPAGGARFVAAPAERCFEAALDHVGLRGELRERGLDAPFESERPPSASGRVFDA